MQQALSSTSWFVVSSGPKIFKRDTDGDWFVQRLSDILDDTKTACYAWSLMPNHFHLLLRTGETPISNVMRRLLTGYAIE